MGQFRNSFFFKITVTRLNIMAYVPLGISFYLHNGIFFGTGFSLTNWMNEQGLSLDGSLSTALSNSLFKMLGIDSFMKEKSCSRSEPPYSTNKLQENGWSSGLYSLSLQKVFLHSSYFLCAPNSLSKLALTNKMKFS